MLQSTQLTLANVPTAGCERTHNKPKLLNFQHLAASHNKHGDVCFDILCTIITRRHARHLDRHSLPLHASEHSPCASSSLVHNFLIVWRFDNTTLAKDGLTGKSRRLEQRFSTLLSDISSEHLFLLCSMRPYMVTLVAIFAAPTVEIPKIGCMATF